MRYKYKPNSKAVVGDIVEYDGTSAYLTSGKLYIVLVIDGEGDVNVTNDRGDAWWMNGNFRTLDTLPGTEAKVGDTAIRTHGNKAALKVGDTFSVTHIVSLGANYVGYAPGFSMDPTSCRVLQYVDEQVEVLNKRSTAGLAAVGGNVSIAKVLADQAQTDAEVNQPTTQQTKENTMNPNTEAPITIAMTAKEYKEYQKGSKQPKVLTDLESALKYPVSLSIYILDGSHSLTEHFKSEKKALKRKDELLNSPYNIGHTVVIVSDAVKSYTTSIPIVEC